MNKAYEKLHEINERINACKKEIKEVKQLPFYTIFHQEAQQQKDLATLHDLLNNLLQQKLETLEALKLYANNEQLSITAQLQHS
ncbi:hypothetical protein GCM10007424_25240 [Flavobacterium suaedae]|uniref:Uncharacterized protein n=1 Tax=Flavobacterium suaedae TaxID=1767027 RepID=A0ABQ1K4T6_9FLAO|nr:hypothetical protein [Flavobacterium suaedae]GGB84165.1 hypothetical protein GCM10007424_25240 [Flavobacterium suaedae]